MSAVHMEPPVKKASVAKTDESPKLSTRVPSRNVKASVPPDINRKTLKIYTRLEDKMIDAKDDYIAQLGDVEHLNHQVVFSPQLLHWTATHPHILVGYYVGVCLLTVVAVLVPMNLYTVLLPILAMVLLGVAVYLSLTQLKVYRHDLSDSRFIGTNLVHYYQRAYPVNPPVTLTQLHLINDRQQQLSIQRMIATTAVLAIMVLLSVSLLLLGIVYL